MNHNSKNNKKRKREGFLAGLIYGLIPHLGCIAFIIFSVLGVTTATAFFKPLLLNPYFFYILIAISLVFATISALFYFKNQGFIILGKSGDGIEISVLPGGFKRKWKYLLTLYGTTIFINLLLFMVIFPIVANLDSESTLTAALMSAFGRGEAQLSDSGFLITLQVAIPCPGHAPLIIGELKKIGGTEGVKFRFPNLFDVGYNPEKTSKEEMLSLDVFDTYKATIIEEEGNQITELIDGVAQPQFQGSPGSCCEGGYGGGGCGCGCGR